MLGRGTGRGGLDGCLRPSGVPTFGPSGGSGAESSVRASLGCHGVPPECHGVPPILGGGALGCPRANGMGWGLERSGAADATGDPGVPNPLPLGDSKEGPAG